MTNKADVNRKEFSLEIWIMLLYATIVVAITSVIVFCMKDCMTRRINAGSRFERYIGDLFAICCALTICYATYWVIASFWRGVYINSELTVEESEAPTQSNFVLIFYFFCLICLTIATPIFCVFSGCGCLAVAVWFDSTRNRQRAYQNSQEAR